MYIYMETVKPIRYSERGGRKMSNYTENRRGNLMLTFTGRDGTTATCEMQSRPGIDCGLATAGFLSSKGWLWGSLKIEPGKHTVGHEWIDGMLKHVRAHLMKRPSVCIERESINKYYQTFTLDIATPSRSG